MAKLTHMPFLCANEPIVCEADGPVEGNFRGNKFTYVPWQISSFPVPNCEVACSPSIVGNLMAVTVQERLESGALITKPRLYNMVQVAEIPVPKGVPSRLRSWCMIDSKAWAYSDSDSVVVYDGTEAFEIYIQNCLRTCPIYRSSRFLLLSTPGKTMLYDIPAKTAGYIKVDGQHVYKASLKIGVKIAYATGDEFTRQVVTAEKWDIEPCDPPAWKPINLDDLEQAPAERTQEQIASILEICKQCENYRPNHVVACRLLRTCSDCRERWRSMLRTELHHCPAKPPKW